MVCVPCVFILNHLKLILEDRITSQHTMDQKGIRKTFVKKDGELNSLNMSLRLRFRPDLFSHEASEAADNDNSLPADEPPSLD